MRKEDKLKPLCSFCDCVKSFGFVKLGRERNVPACRSCARANQLQIKPFNESDIKKLQELQECEDNLEQLERLGQEADLDYQEFHRQQQSQEDI